MRPDQYKQKRSAAYNRGRGRGRSGGDGEGDGQRATQGRAAPAPKARGRGRGRGRGRSDGCGSAALPLAQARPGDLHDLDNAVGDAEDNDFDKLLSEFGSGDGSTSHFRFKNEISAPQSARVFESFSNSTILAQEDKTMHGLVDFTHSELDQLAGDLEHMSLALLLDVDTDDSIMDIIGETTKNARHQGRQPSLDGDRVSSKLRSESTEGELHVKDTTTATVHQSRVDLLENEIKIAASDANDDEQEGLEDWLDSVLD